MQSMKDYKKRFIYSSGLAILSLWVGLFMVGKGGQDPSTFGGSLNLSPLILIDVIVVPLAFIYGFIYLSRTPIQSTKLKVGLTIIVIAALSSLTLLLF